MGLKIQLVAEHSKAMRAEDVDLSGDVSLDRERVAGYFGRFADATMRGEYDDLLTVEGHAPRESPVEVERVGDVVHGRHPAVAEMLGWFEAGHLQDAEMAAVSEQFGALAYSIVNRGTLTGPELTTSLRKLLEAKDCAVRAVLAGRRG